MGRKVGIEGERAVGLGLRKYGIFGTFWNIGISMMIELRMKE